MNYSKIHLKLEEYLSSNVLEHPQLFLGPNYETVLNFWWHLESFLPEDFKSRNVVTIPNYTGHIMHVARKYSTNQADAWAATNDFVLKKTGTNCVQYGWATVELIAMHEILEEYESLHIVPKLLEL